MIQLVCVFNQPSQINLRKIFLLLLQRYNPGSSIASVFKGNSIIGNPSESKFGVTKEQLFSGYKKAQAFGCKRFSLHTMLVSNCLDLEVFAQIAKFMFELVKEIKVQIHVN